jgi:hypothetical protein
MFEVYLIIFPPLLFLVLLYLVGLAARFVRAWERIAEAMETSGILSRSAHITVHADDNRQ